MMWCLIQKVNISRFFWKTRPNFFIIPSLDIQLSLSFFLSVPLISPFSQSQNHSLAAHRQPKNPYVAIMDVWSIVITEVVWRWRGRRRRRTWKTGPPITMLVTTIYDERTSACERSEGQGWSERSDACSIEEIC